MALKWLLTLLVFVCVVARPLAKKTPTYLDPKFVRRPIVLVMFLDDDKYRYLGVSLQRELSSAVFRIVGAKGYTFTAVDGSEVGQAFLAEQNDTAGVGRGSGPPPDKFFLILNLVNIAVTPTSSGYSCEVSVSGVLRNRGNLHVVWRDEGYGVSRSSRTSQATVTQSSAVVAAVTAAIQDLVASLPSYAKS